MVVNVTKENFESEVLKSEGSVLVDFWAPWCGHCINLAPTLDEISADSQGKIKVAKVNVDEEPELAAQFAVMTIPLVLHFKGGEIVGKTVGAFPKAALMQKLGL
ncbi:MAG: thioredoxin [Peptostreptococcaceae bacterium]|nr:thioredoxin [Peptostreptococcaceae bacterium]MDY5739451.1 thioredoxin [Anaerovoracaceae bacterium]